MATRLRIVAASLFSSSSSSSSSSSGMRVLQRRGISISPGARERALLDDDPALKHFKSTKDTVNQVKRFGDVLAIIVGAGCIYQLYDVAQQRRAERLGTSNN